MKILLLNANRVGIGTYHRALYFGRELARRGHDVTMMTVSNERRFRPALRQDRERFTIVECPNFLDELLPWHASGPIDIGLRIREIWRGDYDVVYAFEYQPNISVPVFLLRKLKRFTLLSDWCDWHAGASYHFGGYRWAHAIDRFFEELIRHYAAHVTTINKTLYDRALSIGIAPERVSIVGEGVDPSYIVPHDRGEARQRFGLPADVRIVGTIRDAPKAAEMLCEAVARSRHADLRLLFIGTRLEALVEHARSLGIADRVIAPGRVSDEDLPWWIATSDVMALPLEDNLVNRGRWPHKLGDMLAAQRPVVVSPGGEFTELIAARDCGVVCEYTAAGFAAAIDRILDAPVAYEGMAERGRRLIETELNWDVIGRKLEDALRAVTASLVSEGAATEQALGARERC
jgi:glycosyltransferase involved in cell wall biosynthesis